MTISTILKSKGSNIVSVRPDETIDSAAKCLQREKIGAVLVMDSGGKLCGVLSERDIVNGLANHGSGLLERTVSELMTRDVITCHPSDRVTRVMGMMTDRRIRHLPVLDGGELVGVVSIGDIVKRRMEEIESEAEALRSYIAT